MASSQCPPRVATGSPPATVTLVPKTLGLPMAIGFKACKQHSVRYVGQGRSDIACYNGSVQGSYSIFVYTIHLIQSETDWLLLHPSPILCRMEDGCRW